MSAPPGLWRRAWAVSLIFHLTLTVIMGLVVQRLPRGADMAGMGTGIVLDLQGGGDDGFSVVSETPAPGKELPEPVLNVVQQPRVEALSPSAPVSGNIALEMARVPPIAVPNSEGELRRSIDQAIGGGQAGGDTGVHQAPQPNGPASANAARGSRFTGLGGGSRATVDVFGVKGSGTKFVYLFDRSTSMEGAPLAAAKRQLIASLQSLESIHQFQIIFFNSRPFPIDVTGAGRMAFADERSKRMAANMVGSVTADSGTDRYSALKAAIAFRPDVIFFLTDADDAMLSGEVAEILRANERTGAAICVIEFGREASPPGENFLTRLARETGGQYGYVDATALTQ
jgi:hypothetical protein